MQRRLDEDSWEWPWEPSIRISTHTSQNPHKYRKGKFAVYVNRHRTIQNWKALAEPLFLEAGLKDVQLRRMIRGQFSRAKEGFLLTDGNACGMPIDELDGIWMADLPFSVAEVNLILSGMGAGVSSPLVLRYNQSQVDANRQYLNQAYPDMEYIRSIWSALRYLGQSQLYGELSQFCRRLSPIARQEVTTAGLEAALHILADLGLCQFKKKGSIMAIQLMFDANNSRNISNSPLSGGPGGKKRFRIWSIEFN